MVRDVIKEISGFSTYDFPVITSNPLLRRDDPDAFHLWYYSLAKKDLTVAAKTGTIGFALMLIKEKLVEPYYFLEKEEHLVQFKVLDKDGITALANRLVQEHSHVKPLLDLSTVFLKLRSIF